MFVLVQILGGRSRDLTVFRVEEAGPHREALVSPTSPGLTQTTEAKLDTIRSPPLEGCIGQLCAGILLTLKDVLEHSPRKHVLGLIRYGGFEDGSTCSGVSRRPHRRNLVLNSVSGVAGWVSLEQML